MEREYVDGWYVGFWQTRGVVSAQAYDKPLNCGWVQLRQKKEDELTYYPTAILGESFFFDRDQAVAKAKQLQLEEFSRLADEITRIAAIRF
jgi:hypothetical protein